MTCCSKICFKIISADSELRSLFINNELPLFWHIYMGNGYFGIPKL